MAVFSKIAPLSVHHDIGISKHDQEGRVITLKFADFELVACYTPNSGLSLERVDYRVKEWDVDFFKYIGSLESNSKPIIITGDLNISHNVIDLYNPSGKHKFPGYSPQERKSFDDFLTKRRYVDTFRYLYPTTKKFSFWSLRGNMRSKDKGIRADYFLINKHSISLVSDSLIHN